jgi:hypothetical protein
VIPTLATLWCSARRGIRYRLLLTAALILGAVPPTLLLGAVNAQPEVIFVVAFVWAITGALVFEALRLLAGTVRRLRQRTPTPPPQEQLADRTVYVPVHVPALLWLIVLWRADSDQRGIDFKPPAAPPRSRPREHATA